MHAHKYYHVICKSLFGKQELAGNRWNHIRNQAKILHDSESRQRELIVEASREKDTYTASDNVPVRKGPGHARLLLGLFVPASVILLFSITAYAREDNTQGCAVP